MKTSFQNVTSRFCCGFFAIIQIGLICKMLANYPQWGTKCDRKLLALNVVALERKAYPLAEVLFPLAVNIRALERTG